MTPNLNNLLRTTDLGKFLNTQNRACVGATCTKLRQFERFRRTQNNPQNATSLEKALVVRALLKEFVQDEDLMQNLAWKAVNFFHHTADRGASLQWAADFLNVTTKEATKYGSIGANTMERLLRKKIKKIDGILLTLIQQLGKKSNVNNNTGITTLLGNAPIRFNFNTFRTPGSNKASRF